MTPEVKEKKSDPMLAKYRKYVGELATNNPTAIPVNYDEFKKNYVAEETKKDAEQDINPDTLTDVQKAALSVLGFEITDHTPENGQFAGKVGKYITNKDANVSGAGFLRLRRDKLENTLKRLMLNVDAINVVLGK